MRFTTKSTIYLIDGCNLIQSSRGHGSSFNLKEAEEKFFEWLEGICDIENFRSSTFRIIMDGGFRSINKNIHPAINVVFTDNESADDWIVERAYYFKTKNIRTVAVSSDRGLIERLKADGINCIPCKKFISVCDKLVAKEFKD